MRVSELLIDIEIYFLFSFNGSIQSDGKELSGRSTTSPHPTFRLQRKHYKSRKNSPNQIRPFSPYYSSVATSPIESDR